MIRYLMSAWLMICVLFSASAVFAKTRIAVIDVTARSKDSKNITPRIKTAVNKRKGVTLVTTKGLPNRFKKKYKLSAKIMATSKLRRKYRKRFRRALKKENIDGLIIVEAQRKGSKVQMVVIGQSGKQLDDNTVSTKRRKLSAKKARLMASNAVKLIREDMPEEKSEEKPKEAPKPKSKPKEDTKANKSVKVVEKDDDPIIPTDPETVSDLFDDGFMIGIGAVFGRRSLLSVGQETELSHVAPFFGPTVHLSFTTLLMEDKAQLGIDGHFSYSPFTTESVDENGEPTQLDSRVLRGGANLSFNYALADIFALGASGGVDYLSVGIADNPTYVGHNYTIARIGLQLLVRPIDQLLIQAGGGFLPFASFAYGADGQTIDASTTGFDANAGLTLNLSDNLRAQLQYRFTSLSPTDDDPAETTDTIHQGNILVGWLF